MADCYDHGSSAPGPCPDCEHEDRHGLERGTVEFQGDEKMTPKEQLAKEKGMTLEEVSEIFDQ